MKEDFAKPAAPGRLSQVYGDRFGVYGPYATSSAGWWLPENISVRDGVLRMFNGYKNGRPTSAGFSVDRLTRAESGSGFLTYARSEVRVRADNAMPGYGSAILWWPKYGWPATGELDFPEGSFNAEVHAYTHFTGATSGGDQSSHSAGKIWGRWHTYVTEWTPSRVAYYVDGKLIGQDTHRIPTTPFTFALQTGVSDKAQMPSRATSGNLLVDSITIWRWKA